MPRTQKVFLQLAKVPSPVGELWLVLQAGRLLGLHFADLGATETLRSFEQRYPDVSIEHVAPPRAIGQALAAYFKGRVDALDDIAIAPIGTPFQIKVWRRLRRVPAGTTVSYGELARLVGHPRATRAVGSANARNPIAQIVPCHRVIASDGSLGGYGAGLPLKRFLLDHEQRHTAGRSKARPASRRT
jgi:methylated-DNA-[protein]-cysteine S-methyltransferase